MAIVEVKVPQLSESVAEATLLQWKKNPGDSVALDEILVEIETDKVVLEVPAPSAGTLAELLVADGATVLAEQLIARIDSEGRVAAPAAAPAGTAAAAVPAPAAAPAGEAMAGVAMPSAAKLMADKQLAAGSVAGSGKDGRVLKGDVLAVVAATARPAPAAAARSGAMPVAVAAAALPQHEKATRLVLVGPAAANFVVAPVPADTLVIHGEADDVVPLAATLAWARPQNLPVVVVPGGGHFFHGQLPLLKSVVVRYLSATMA